MAGLTDKARHVSRVRGIGAKICVLIVLWSGITACSTLPPVRQPDPREDAVHRYRYQGLRDELIVELPRLSPPVAGPGDKITREIKFTILSPDKNKRFKVTEATTLSGAKLLINLSRQELERPQGTHVSTIQVEVPKDLPSGEYTLVTTIATEEQQATQKASFLVVK